jgi:hypothetical protein
MGVTNFAHRLEDCRQIVNYASNGLQTLGCPVQSIVVDVTLSVSLLLGVDGHVHVVKGRNRLQGFDTPKFNLCTASVKIGFVRCTREECERADVGTGERERMVDDLVVP